MSFAETLAKLRLRADLTQADLAMKAEIPLDTLRRWEQGKNLPRIDVAYRLARALGVSVEELITAKDMKEATAEAKPKRKPRKPRKGK